MKIPGRIPVYIHPTFWLFSGVIGYWNGGTLIAALVWIGIILVSVLVHEFGHALMAFCFGLKPRIELVALGGLTYHNGQHLRFWKQFLIVLNGPLFGFLLVLLSTLMLQMPSVQQSQWGYLWELFGVVNLFWTVVNLLPILPLDGGQLLRLVLERWIGVKGMKWSLIISLTLALSIGLYAMARSFILGGVIFFLLAFQSYDLLRKTRHLAKADQDEELKTWLTIAEQKLATGEKAEAEALLMKIRTKAKEGVIFHVATQYLAILQYGEGHTTEAYRLLVPIRCALEQEGLCLLHKTAFEERDFPLVAELAAECYQVLPTIDMALRNAYAHAAMAQSTPAIGWLETALQEGLENLGEIVQSAGFDPIRQDPAFQAFLLDRTKGNK